MQERSQVAVILLALSAAAARLVPLQWLHPLQWDEVEYFRATDWVRRGLVPFRDFWEHHTPLQWIVFAPFTALTNSAGVDAIVTMRWAQVPLWIATFWMLNAWMRRAGLGRFARWSAMALALSSSMFMTPAIEYRVDTLGCALYVAGLYFAQRAWERRWCGFASGAAFCLAAFANLRLGPLLVVTVLLLMLTDTRERAWRVDKFGIAIGGVVTLAIAIALFAMTRSLEPLLRHVWTENYLGDRYATAIPHAFLTRVATTFGARMTEVFQFDVAAIDVAGVLVLLVGTAGLVLALRAWRAPDDRFVLALVQIASLLFVMRMKFVYNYHLEIIVLLMVPLIAGVVDVLPRRDLVLALLAVAWGVNLFASVFRGKELDRAYQDVVMREVHARTKPGDRVFDGVGWALRREPAYRLWFLPDLARQLVAHGHAPRYDMADPPAAIVADQNALRWLAADPELRKSVTRHYLPVWRNLWLPGLSARIDPGATATWRLPADGDYRVFASPRIAGHPWFARPLFVGSYFGDDADRMTLRLPRPSLHPDLEGVNAPVMRLVKGQTLTLSNRGTRALGVLLVPGDDAFLFRQPPPNVTIDGAAPRVTHVPF